MTIDDFIYKLSQYKTSDTVFNMYYGDSKSAIACRKHLKDYLEKRKDANTLLVGEAPGYNGCAKTGVPFTSDSGEPSSKIIQNFFIREFNGPRDDVLIWNAFPFHPHKKEDNNTNRTPNAKELKIGIDYLKQLFQTFPNIVCVGAIGNTAYNALKKIELDYAPSKIRHPAHGGKKECEEGLFLAFNRFALILLEEDIMKNVAEHTNNPEKAYKYLKEHRDEFFDWRQSSDHDEYDYAYFSIKNIDLD